MIYPNNYNDISIILIKHPWVATEKATAVFEWRAFIHLWNKQRERQTDQFKINCICIWKMKKQTKKEKQPKNRIKNKQKNGKLR